MAFYLELFLERFAVLFLKMSFGAVPSCSRPWYLFQCKWPPSGAFRASVCAYLSSTKPTDVLVFELDSLA